MITEDERFIKIQGILAFSDIHPNDCIKINDLIIDLSKQKQQLQNQVEKLTQENNDLESKYQSKNDEYIKAMLKMCDLQEENEYLKDKINTYENLADLTLMFMYCDEKAKDKIKELQSVIDKAIEYLKRKEKEPEWYDTDFMICINILNGGSGNFDEILRSKE